MPGGPSDRSASPRLRASADRSGPTATASISSARLVASNSSDVEIKSAARPRSPVAIDISKLAREFLLSTGCLPGRTVGRVVRGHRYRRPPYHGHPHQALLAFAAATNVQIVRLVDDVEHMAPVSDGCTDPVCGRLQQQLRHFQVNVSAARRDRPRSQPPGNLAPPRRPPSCRQSLSRISRSSTVPAGGVVDADGARSTRQENGTRVAVAVEVLQGDDAYLA